MVAGFICWTAAGAVAQDESEQRVWTSRGGQYTVRATLVARDGDNVKLRKADGSVIEVTLDQLSDADRQFVEDWERSPTEKSGADTSPVFPPDVLGEPVDLLGNVSTSRDTLKGSWVPEAGTLVAQGEGRSVLQIQQELPDQYVLQCTLTRFAGNRGINLGIVVGGNPVMLVIDSFEGAFSGLKTVGSTNERDNPTLFRRSVLSPTPTQIICTVHRHHVHVKCDGKTLIEWFGNPDELSRFQQYWAEFPGDKILLGTWGPGLQVNKLTLTPIESSGWDSFTVPAGERDAADSVALIEHALGSGSGFLAARNVLVTNHHVIASAFLGDLSIRFPNQRGTLKAKQLLYESSERDLAILLVETNRVPLPIAFDGAFDTGDEIIVYGNPSVGGGITLRNASVTGKISANVLIEGQDYFQIDASVNPGSSGGPITNNSGQVIGVTAMKATDEGEDMIREGMQRLDETFRSVEEQRGVAFGIPGGDLANAVDMVRTQSILAARQLSARHDVRVTFHRLSMLFRLRLLRALAEGSDELRTDALRAQRGSRNRDFVELLPPEACRSILQEMERGRVATVMKLYEEGLADRIDALRNRADVSDETKRDLYELQKLAESAQRVAERRPTTYLSFSKKLLTLQENFKKRLERMEEDL
jgi:S1-C subfamily serine protease